MSAQISGSAASELLNELSAAHNRRDLAAVLAHLLDYLPDEPLAANRAKPLEMTKGICSDTWIEALDAHGAELPINVLRAGLSVSLRHVSRDNHLLLRDALDQAMSGVLLFNIQADREQYGTIGSWPRRRSGTPVQH